MTTGDIVRCFRCGQAILVRAAIETLSVDRASLARVWTCHDTDRCDAALSAQRERVMRAEAERTPSGGHISR